jgi:hypothetical protein
MDVSRYAICGLIGLRALAVFGQRSIAAESVPATALPAIPEDLKYLFELRWCSYLIRGGRRFAQGMLFRIMP